MIFDSKGIDTFKKKWLELVNSFKDRKNGITEPFSDQISSFNKSMDEYKTKLNSIKEMKQQLSTLLTLRDKGLVDTEEYNKRLKSADKAVQDYLETIGDGKGDVEEFARVHEDLAGELPKLSAGAKMAAVGINLLKSAASMVAGALVSIAVQKFIELCSDLYVNMSEAADAVKEGADNIEYLNDMFGKYEDIANSTELYAEKTKQLDEWKKNLIKRYYSEKDAIDAITLSLGSQEAAQKRLMQLEVDRSITKTSGRYKESVKAVENKTPIEIGGFAAKQDRVDDINKFFSEYGIGVEYGPSFSTGEIIYEIKIEGNAVEKMDKLTTILAELDNLENSENLPFELASVQEDLSIAYQNLSRQVNEDVLEVYNQGTQDRALKFVLSDEVQKWIDLVKEGQMEYDALIAKINDPKQNGGKSNAIVQETISLVDSLYPELKAKSEEAAGSNEKYSESLKNLSSSVSSASTLISSLGTAYSEFVEHGAASADTLKGLYESFENVEGAAALIDKFAGAETADEAKAALVELSETVVNSMNSLKDLDDSQKQAAVSQLKLIGVTNAEAVVTAAIVKNKIDSKDASESLTAEEEELYKTLLLSSGAAKDEAQALSLLSVYKKLASTNSLKDATLDDLQAILNENEALQFSAELIGNIIKLKALKHRIDTVTDPEELDNLMDEYKKIAAEVEQQLSHAVRATVGDEIDPFNYATYKQLLAEKKHLLAMGKITEEEYYNELRRLNEEYLKDSEKYIDEYRSNEEALYQYQHTIYEKKVADLKNQLDMQLITELEYYKEFEKLNEQYLSKDSNYASEYASNKVEIWKFYKESVEGLYETTKDMVKESLNEQSDALEKEKDALKQATDDSVKAIEREVDAYEKAASKKVKAIEKQVKALEESTKAQKESLQKQKSEMQDSVKAQIDSLNDQKDAIQDAADAEKKAAEERYKAVEKEINNKLDLLEKERKAYQDIAEAKKKAIKDEADTEDYEYELSKKQSKLAELLREQASLQNDNSSSAQKRKAELTDEIAEAQRELSVFVRDHNIDLAIDAIDEDLKNKEDLLDSRKEDLNAELDAKKEAYSLEQEMIESTKQAQLDSIEAQIKALNSYQEVREKYFDQQIEMLEKELETKKKAFDDEKERIEEQKEAYKEAAEVKKNALKDYEETKTRALDKEIKEIKEHLENEGYLHNLTLDQLENRDGQLYTKLTEYNNNYGTSIENDITNKWNAANEALQKYAQSAATMSSLSTLYTLLSTTMNLAGSAPKHAAGTRSLPRSGIVETDEQGYEIKLNKTSGRHFEYMNAGSVILPNDATQKIMAFISNPANFIRSVVGAPVSQPVSAIEGDVSAINNSISAPIEIVNNYQITGDNPREIASEIKKISQDCVDKAFERLNTTLRRNGMGRSVKQMV